jgi:hypothetical protein
LNQPNNYSKVAILLPVQAAMLKLPQFLTLVMEAQHQLIYDT